MPNTRSSNKTANFKAYYSKKAAPYQQHFPHRRKIVRRPDPQDGSGKKQLKFLPEMMKRKSTVQDSDAEDALSSDEEEERVEVPSKRRGRKRNSDVMRSGEPEEEEDEPVRPTPKRRRKAATPASVPKPNPRRRRAAPVAPVSDNSDASEIEAAAQPRLLRRQSTMTQIVDGRLPPPGSADPEFKPVKRTPRTSWGGKGSKKSAEKDLKQRTLTQMVHTMTPLILGSDEELEDNETDEEAVAAHRSFIFGDDADVAQQSPAEDNNEQKENIPPVEDSVPIPGNDSDVEDEYQPTQFIEAPTTKTRRTPLRASTRRQATPAAKKSLKVPIQKSPKSRFGLLSTPEKRGVFEIPSSQSPPDTPMSTQPTPRRSGRKPLQPRSANTNNVVEPPVNPGEETPSRRKQVTFQEGHEERIPPPTLRKFTSTIPDSEDEDAGFSESDGESDAEYGVGEETQGLLRRVDGPILGKNVGQETQAMLRDIDLACANANEDNDRADREGSEELEELVNHQHEDVSQELGIQPELQTEADEESSDTPELPSLPFSSPKPQAGTSAAAEPTETVASPPLIQALPSSPPIQDFLTQPTIPMFNDDDSPEELESPTIVAEQQPSTPVQQPQPSTLLEEFKTQPSLPMFSDDDDDEGTSDDLDDLAPLATGTTLNHSVQVPRSPVAHLPAEPSHSSQAEQQLRTEFELYSQFRRPGHGPDPSSMHVAHDSNPSYQATPHLFPRQATQVGAGLVSQATTVDPTQMSPKATPRKTKRAPMFTSPKTRTPQSHPKRTPATTPKSIRHTQPAGTAMSSPEATRPAPLFIPSSFPSPARVTMEGWSSPVVGREEGRGESQWMGSLEEFSIPAPPPPGSSQWVDEEEDE